MARIAGIIVVALIVTAMPASTGSLELEAGAGITVFPIRGADVGPFVSVAVFDVPDSIPVLGDETVFLDFGQLDGVATVGPAVSVSAGDVDVRLRIGVSVWRGGQLDSTVYLRYGVPLRVNW